MLGKEAQEHLPTLTNALLRFHTLDIPELVELATEVTTSLETAVNVSRQELFNRQVSLLPDLLQKSELWPKDPLYAHDLQQVEALLSLVSFDSLSPHLSEIISSFSVLLKDSEVEIALRERLLRAIQRLIRLPKENSMDSWNSALPDLVEQILLPSCSWTSNKQSKGLRNEAQTLLFELLKGYSASVPQETFAKVIPTLVSSLEEDSADIRKGACHALEHLFSSSKFTFSDETLAKVEKSLVKRLDDTEDNVRIAASDTLNSLLSVFSPGVEEISSLTKTLGIHLDDSNGSVKSSVANTIRRIASQQPLVVEQVLEETKTKHSDPEFCEELIRFAKSKAESK